MSKEAEELQKAAEFYRRTGSGDEIPDLQQDLICYSPDQMIWFASKYAEHHFNKELEKRMPSSEQQKNKIHQIIISAGYAVTLMSVVENSINRYNNWLKQHILNKVK